MTTYPRRLNAYFRSSLPTTVTKELAEQEQLLRIVRAALPPSQASQCRHCIKKGGTLIIQVESSASASLLRFQIPALQARLATEHGLQTTKVLIRNLIPTTSPTPANQPAPCANSCAGAQIIEGAEGCAADEIRAALLRLGQTLTLKGSSKRRQ